MASERIWLKMDRVILSLEDKILLESASYDFLESKHYILQGESGSGKTSLLHCFFGFIDITSGSLFFNSKLFNLKTINHLRSRVAFLDQEPFIGHDQDTVMDSFTLFYHLQRHLQTHQHHLIQELEQKRKGLFKELSLEEDLLSKTCSTLSGGERHRIAFVQTLLLGKKILLADEPMAAIDSKNKKLLYDLIRKHFDSSIIVSHDEEVASDTKYIILKNKKILNLDGTIND